jgi:hypothetical protein
MCCPLQPGSSQLGFKLLTLEKQISSALCNKQNGDSLLSITCMILFLSSGALSLKALHSYGGWDPVHPAISANLTSSGPGRESLERCRLEPHGPRQMATSCPPACLAHLSLCTLLPSGGRPPAPIQRVLLLPCSTSPSTSDQ